MKHPTEAVDVINKILDVADSMPSSSKGNSIINFDALHAIRKVLGRKNEWDLIRHKTRLKTNLKKNSIVI